LASGDQSRYSSAMGEFTGQNLACVRGERAVFVGLDFSVAPGGALVLRGPNGCGKSSLLRMLAGLLPAAAGALLWDGAPVADDIEDHRARLHYVGHHDPIKAVLTVLENLTFWARLRGGDAAAAAAALDRLGIAYLADVPGRFLSAGQRRLSNLARLLAMPAPLWLLDEPTVALDTRAVGALEAAIEAHRASGGMVIAATHTAIAMAGAAVLDVGAFRATPATADAFGAFDDGGTLESGQPAL